jgi:uncharacterized delta-60 repeat protein
MMTRISAALALTLTCTQAFAAGGALDTTLGTAGVAHVLETTNDLNVVFTRMPDGKYLVVRNTDDSVVVMRRLADGNPDLTFGTAGHVVHGRAAPVGSPAGIVPLAVRRILLQGNKILLAGEATSACGTPGIARLNANGSVDMTFGFRGWSTPVPATRGIASCTSGLYFQVGDFRILPDGRIMMVAQPFEREMLVAMNGDHIAVRWSANGAHDAAYGGRGWVSGFSWYAYPGGARIFDDGSAAVVRGELAPPGNVLRVTASRLTPAGERTDAVLPLPPNVPGAALVMPIAAVQGDGTIIVTRPAPGGLGVMRFRNNVLDTGYGNGGTATVSPATVRGLFPTPDEGTLVVVDSESASVDGRNESIVFLKLDARGRLEPSFGINGRANLSTSELSEFPFQMSLDADGYLALYAYTSFRSGGEARYNFYFARVQAVPDIVEFENVPRRHFFITYDNAEARGIDAGLAGPGWRRTGESFRPGGPASVCRFVGTPVIGPNSHFFSAVPDECELVTHDRGWTYEGQGFSTTAPADGRCARDMRPVYRLYNNRWPQNDSNHRFVPNESLLESMVAQGWTLEPIAFCTPR